MVTAKPVRVAVYARVSTQEQATEGTSLEYQAGQLESYCESQGWVIWQSYVDPGYTGKDGDRPGLKRLLADAKLGLFEKVVVHKLDRLARKLRLLLEIEEKLKEHGVALHSVKETIDTSTPIGRTVFQMLGLVSEWERDTIADRTRTGRLQRYKEGCWGPGRPPFGYSYNRETKKLVINENEARIVRRIFEEYAAGKSMVRIANMLNDERIPPRRKDGKGWRNTSIRDILFNPIYKGTQTVNIYQQHKGRPKEIPYHAITIKVDATVSDALWDIAQERRRNNKHLQPPRNGHWLLQGLVTCGLCGYGFRTEVTHNRRCYGCRGRLKYTHVDGSPRCTSPRLDAEWLEENLWQRVAAIINDPNRLEALLKETVDNLRNRQADLSVRIRPVDAQLAEISEQKARLAEDWVQLSMGPRKCQELKRGLEQEESRLRSIRAEIDPTQLEELEHTRATLRFWETQLQALAWDTEEEEEGRKTRIVDSPHQTALKIVGFENEQITKAMNFPATRRELLDLLQVRCVVFEDRVEVKAVFPIEPIRGQWLYSGCRSGRCPQSR
jgi:site-specific DNA recombinase